jgi:hypothetical protein
MIWRDFWTRFLSRLSIPSRWPTHNPQLEVGLNPQINPPSKIMHLLSSTATALLGVLLGVASFDNACAHDSRGLRGLMHDNTETGSSSIPRCGSRARTENEVKAFSSMVKQFYEEAQQSPSGNRRLQETIKIDVNFVILKSTTGLGATDEQVKAQIDVLNDAFRPDFAFNLTTTQVVTNDTYFFNVTQYGPVETQMETDYKRGGRETLNVYALKPNEVGLGGWANGGVVMDYTGLPNGGHHVYSKGFVSVGWNTR